jgi:hypothetical protein
MGSQEAGGPAVECKSPCGQSTLEQVPECKSLPAGRHPYLSGWHDVHVPGRRVLACREAAGQTLEQRPMSAETLHVASLDTWCREAHVHRAKSLQVGDPMGIH